DFKVAELTYMNYIDVFKFEDLFVRPKSYFMKVASEAYLSADKYKRFVISLLIRNNLSGLNWVLDAAAGRGADLHRYQEVGVKNLLAIDADASAIAELIRRKFEMFALKKRRIQQWYKTSTVVNKYDRVQGKSTEEVV